MSELHARPDPREVLTSAILDRSRTTRKAVLADLRPNLARRHRAFAEDLARAMTRDDLFSDRFATDLETLIDVAECEVERGTIRADVSDTSPECISTSTWVEMRRTAEADAISGALAEMRRLLALLHRLHDAVAAECMVQGPS